MWTCESVIDVKVHVKLILGVTVDDPSQLHSVGGQVLGTSDMKEIELE